MDGRTMARDAKLERDVCEAQDRATGLQTLWQNCKNDLVAARLDAAASQRQLTAERAKLRQAKDQADELASKVTGQEKRIKNLEYDLRQAEAKMKELKEAVSSKDIQINFINQKLQSTKESSSEQKAEIDSLKKLLDEKSAKAEETTSELESVKEQLKIVNEKINSWPFRFISRTIDFSSHFNVFGKIVCLTNDLTNYSFSVLKNVLSKISIF